MSLNFTTKKYIFKGVLFFFHDNKINMNNLFVVVEQFYNKLLKVTFYDFSQNCQETEESNAGC
jgi:hypothetical protein